MRHPLAAGDSRGDELVLASLNSHGGRGADGRPYDLGAACDGLKADVIALQEVFHPRGQPGRIEEIATALGAEAVHAYLLDQTDLHTMNISAETRPGRWGITLLSTVPVVHHEIVALGRTPGDATPRVAQLVTLETPGGGRIRIANTHLTYLLASPVQLIRLLRRLAASSVRTVITGDLNMPLPVTGLAAGYAPAVVGRTYPAHRPLLQLDHVLAGRGVTRCGGEVLPAAGSDHLPVRARLRLTGPAGA